jgi:hypothetical protein
MTAVPERRETDDGLHQEKLHSEDDVVALIRDPFRTTIGRIGAN